MRIRFVEAYFLHASICLPSSASISSMVFFELQLAFFWRVLKMILFPWRKQSMTFYICIGRSNADQVITASYTDQKSNARRLSDCYRYAVVFWRLDYVGQIIIDRNIFLTNPISHWSSWDRLRSFFDQLMHIPFSVWCTTYLTAKITATLDN